MDTDFKISVLDYLGRIDNGVIVLVSIVYKDKYYEGMYYYDNKNKVLTVEDNLEKEINCKINDHYSYKDLINTLTKSVIPYDEIISRIDELDLSVYSKNKTTETVHVGRDIKEEDIKIIDKDNTDRNKKI